MAGASHAGGRPGPDSAEVRDNPAKHRFEVLVDGDVAGFAAYRLENGVDGTDGTDGTDRTVAFLHTVVDDAYEGRGLGSRLVREALRQVADRGAAVLPYCPFVRDYLHRHPELADLVPADRHAEFGLGRSA